MTIPLACSSLEARSSFNRWVYGDHTCDVFATGGEVELQQVSVLWPYRWGVRHWGWSGALTGECIVTIPVRCSPLGLKWSFNRWVYCDHTGEVFATGVEVELQQVSVRWTYWWRVRYWRRGGASTGECTVTIPVACSPLGMRCSFNRWVYGEHTGDVFATGGEVELQQVSVLWPYRWGVRHWGWSGALTGECIVTIPVRCSPLGLKWSFNRWVYGDHTVTCSLLGARWSFNGWVYGDHTDGMFSNGDEVELQQVSTHWPYCRRVRALVAM